MKVMLCRSHTLTITLLHDGQWHELEDPIMRLMLRAPLVDIVLKKFADRTMNITLMQAPCSVAWAADQRCGRSGDCSAVPRSSSFNLTVQRSGAPLDVMNVTVCAIGGTAVEGSFAIVNRTVMWAAGATNGIVEVYVRPVRSTSVKASTIVFSLSVTTSHCTASHVTNLTVTLAPVCTLRLLTQSGGTEETIQHGDVLSFWVMRSEACITNGIGNSVRVSVRLTVRLRCVISAVGFVFFSKRVSEIP